MEVQIGSINTESQENIKLNRLQNNEKCTHVSDVK